MCLLFFLSNFYFFIKWQAFKNYEKCFLFHLKRSFRYRDIHIFATLSSYLDNWWRHELKALSSIILESNGQQVEKEGMTEIQKLEYLENEKSSLVEIKRIFNSVWRAIIPWKNKNLMKIANKSFKIFWCNFSVKLPWLQRKGNKLNTRLFDSIYKIVKPSHLEKLQSYQMETN